MKFFKNCCFASVIIIFMIFLVTIDFIMTCERMTNGEKASYKMSNDAVPVKRGTEISKVTVDSMAKFSRSWI